MARTHNIPAFVWLMLRGRIVRGKRAREREREREREAVIVSHSYVYETRCAICLCDFRDREELAWTVCGHSHHLACLLAWHAASNKTECPVCKRPA